MGFGDLIERRCLYEKVNASLESKVQFRFLAGCNRMSSLEIQIGSRMVDNLRLFLQRPNIPQTIVDDFIFTKKVDHRPSKQRHPNPKPWPKR